ncbi:hypothetical protein NDN08_005914 [Rhodosorus marinus]|uniref:Endonuclease/exonuclease/phosphatase domain-containing protein n=1 Tax=Rhodosorus marinus TaxID=101924 RepID=A0AAV8V568_9RHOD|nr:hypothetical protein NDN08_005914 [Rhodosorus marinus]
MVSMTCFVGASNGRITKKPPLRSLSSSQGQWLRARNYLARAVTCVHLQPMRQDERIRPDENHELRQHISVATYNVYMDGHLAFPGNLKTAHVIAQSGADIVCLQETNRCWEKFLLEQQSVTEAYQHIRFLHHRWRHGGVAILSKLPLGASDLVSKEIFFGWYPAWKTSVIVDERISELEIVNLHLRAAFPSLPWKVEKQRLQEVQTHCECLLEDQGKIPTIVLGDLNTSNALCTRFLEQEMGLVNALSQHCSSSRTHTWHGKFLGLKLRAVYDHVFYNPALLTCVGAEVVEAGGSDHYPLITQFQFQPGLE